MDEKWRPTDWDRIKHNIVMDTPLIFSPSTGYSKDQKDLLVEKSASAILKALMELKVNDKG
jgi:hypothetical protein